LTRRIAILDPFSGIAGDMLLGSLVAVGLSPEWLRALPGRLGLDDVHVEIKPVLRKHLACTKVDFVIPPQPHSRGLPEIRRILDEAELPAEVRAKAGGAFDLLAEAEAGVHGTSPERIHFHEVGAVDAILDIVGSIWGLAELGVEEVYSGTITFGDGLVRAAHGVLPVPAPATMSLLAGHPVRPGPPESGELVTPTGAVLVRTLSLGRPPALFTPVGSGMGAGTKELPDRANALRIILGDIDANGVRSERLVQIVADIDDMTPEYLAGLADRVRAAGALDVTLVAIMMKKGRAGHRIEVLTTPADSRRLEEVLLHESTSIGVRSFDVTRSALPREQREVEVLGHPVAVKLVRLPDGSVRGKPEFEDVDRVALATGRRREDIFRLALTAAERL
jgi:pyridinium-3,5-bisthiocarboxylic acid mononucleotide nickel chelatase